MLHQKILARVIGISQLILAVAFLFFIDLFFTSFGFSPATTDQKYLFGQLAARFSAYGLGMFVIARNPFINRTWWDLMALTQAIDFSVGLYYLLSGGIKIETAAFPMFNAAVFCVLLFIWRPQGGKSIPSTHADHRSHEH
jgi:hypothetical protein